MEQKKGKVMIRNVPSYIEGKWHTAKKLGAPIFHAVTGEQIASVSSEGVQFSNVLSYARNVAGPKLRKLTFHQRAEILKKLGLYLLEHKEIFYKASEPTGATRADSWIDIEGGVGTLFSFSSKARRELPDLAHHVEGQPERLSKEGSFIGQHLCVPLEGAAIHINAFNFPCWGMLEKFAPSFIAGVPSIIKPASVTCYVAERMVASIIESGLLPEGSLQLICGSLGDTLEHVTCQDAVTFTGSKATGSLLKNHPKVIEHSVRFNLEADSLNCSILGTDATPGTNEFNIFIKEVTREITVKAGQKCTVIRRIFVPENLQDEVIKALTERLKKTSIGNPSSEGVRMGPLVSKDQREDVSKVLASLLKQAKNVSGELDDFSVVGADKKKGAFFKPTLLHCEQPNKSEAVHELEAFGPISTLMPYKSASDVVTLARKGGGSLVASLISKDESLSREIALGISPFHGRLLILNSDCEKESTGNGSPMPQLVHGGPGRAGGGEELGGVRSVFHYMQRVALQGSPSMLSAVSGAWLHGAKTITDRIHPFRKFYDELQIGESYQTKTRTITEEDVEKFAKLSGDMFYAHMDEAASKASLFGARVAHGYFVISAAAGLFVDPAPGPVLANYGLEGLRFTKPVYFGDTIQVRLTCKQKTPKSGQEQGVVYWEVEVQNQHKEIVALYTILTLVARKSRSNHLA